MRGDGEGMRPQAGIARASRSTEDLISHLEALRLAGSAQLQDARRTATIAVAIAKQSGRLRAGLFEAATAVWEALYGNPAAAREKVATALALGRGREVDYAAAFALAVSGDVSRSRALAGDLARDYPQDTSVNIFYYLPTLRALFALDARDAPAAIQSLQTASRFYLAMGGIGFNGSLGQALSDLRSRLFHPGGAVVEAAAEFQRIVDHRSIVLVAGAPGSIGTSGAPSGSPYQLQSGRRLLREAQTTHEITITRM